ncbi:MAG: hypothetical protein K8L99_02450 [Anaerolineae bacterium]|nr:hypothetical protein [Anaerolineae bacterium]
MTAIQHSFIELIEEVPRETVDTATIDRLLYLIKRVSCARQRVITWNCWMLAEHQPLGYTRPYLKNQSLLPRAFYALTWKGWLVGIEHFQDSVHSKERVRYGLALELARRGWVPDAVRSMEYYETWNRAAHRLPRILKDDPIHIHYEDTPLGSGDGAGLCLYRGTWAMGKVKGK